MTSINTAEKDRELDELIAAVKTRAANIQQLKKGSVWKWVLAAGLAVTVFVILGIVYYLIQRRSKELAQMRTTLEQNKVLLDQKKHEILHAKYLEKRDVLERDVLALSNIIRDQALKIKLLEAAHNRRKADIEKIQVWNQLNDV